MYPRLQDGVSIGTFTYKGSSEKHYFVENKHEDQFEVSYHVYKELIHADGTHALHISKNLLSRMKKDKVLTTSRYVFDGIISRFVLVPLGKSIARFQPICRTINTVLPFVAVILFSVSVFLKQKHTPYSTSDLNVILYYLLILLSLAIHEYSHLISGIACGYRFTQMGLLVLGIFPVGAYVSHLEKKKIGHRARLQFSLAGIEANILIAAVFLLLSMIPSSLDTTLVAAANINVLLAVLNALPASGLDGELALSALLGTGRISDFAKLFFTNKRFRKRVLRAGTPGYACTVLFAINLISTIFICVLIICDVLIVCYNIFL